MEGKFDQSGGHGLKILNHLKRHLLEVEDPSHKSLTNREVCNAFVELSESVCSAAQKPNSGQLISQTIELLVHGCSSQDQLIRVSSSENLKKLIKVLMFTHLSRIQQDLFHELKKNGTSRSLCVALDCFAALFPLTRPSKCSSYAQSLLPIVVRLTERQEEALHETLQGALATILPTMSPFLSATNLQFLMTAFVNRLPTGSPTYRRMASSALISVLLHCKSPKVQSEWVMSRLLVMGSNSKAKTDIVQGVLLVFQHIFSNLQQLNPSESLVKQAYCFLMSCLLYRDTNTNISALECLHQLLLSATPALTVWLVQPLVQAQLAIDYWASDVASAGTPSDTHSLGDGLEITCDSYFDNESLILSYGSESGDSIQPATGLANVVAKASVEENGPPSLRAVKVLETTSSVSRDGSQVLLETLMEYLLTCVLNKVRVSAQSLGLACITAAVDLCPEILHSLDSVIPFISAEDPKLRSRVVKLLSVVTSCQLRAHNRDFSQCPPILNTCCELLLTMLDDDTPVVLKAVCEALQHCLPFIVSSTKPEIVIEIIKKLFCFRESTYWLTKVELLQTLGCLDFTSLAILDSKLPQVVLREVIFQLLGDPDHRVRAAACQCLVHLAPNLDLRQDKLLSLAKYHSSEIFLPLTLNASFGQLSLASIGDSMDKHSPKPPLGLEHLIWFLVDNISSSVNVSLQLGCLEALHSLCQFFPPPALFEEWGCNSTPCTLLDTLLQLLAASKIPWGVQSHGDLLEVTTAVFLAYALCHLTGPEKQLPAEAPYIYQASQLLTHIVRMLAVFVHVIEGREPESKEKKTILSPKKPVSGDSPKAKGQGFHSDLFQKPPLAPRDGLGYFVNLPQFMRIHDACKAAYSNYKLSLGLVGTDKFSSLLQNCHSSLAAILEMSTTELFGKHVEEILNYVTYTVKVDPPGGLLCVQQLLNSLFGLNVATQRTHLHSPYISSLPYNMVTLWSSSATSVYDVVITEPMRQVFPWLSGVQPADHIGKKKHHLVSGKKALVPKPAHSVSSIKDYLGYFEPLVVHALSIFSSTSNTVLQQRVLFLLVQLLNLKVRYELLDCHHTFFDSVVKLVSLLEEGVVKGGETLVPHLFQFLVLLAYDQSKLITVPEVMQKCDGVMASGHNVLTFAIPALQPLVLNLFVRPSRENADLEIQREVVMSMLLRLVEYPRVVALLVHVLDCYRKTRPKWHQASNQIFAALLPQIGKLHVVLESSGSLASLYQLLMSMDSSVISVQALFTAILKPQLLVTVTSVIRWVGGVCTLLELMVSSFPEKEVLEAVSHSSCNVPKVVTDFINVEIDKCDTEFEPPTKLALFGRSVLTLSTSVLSRLIKMRSIGNHDLLAFLCVYLVILLQKLVSGSYTATKLAFERLPESSLLEDTLSELATLYPLLTLNYINFSITTSGIEQKLLLKFLVGCESTGKSSKTLLQHSTLLLLNKHWQDSTTTVSPLVFAALTKSPALLPNCQKTGVRKFVKFNHEAVEVQECLLELIKSTDKSSLINCVNVLRLASLIPCLSSFKFICFEIIPYAVASVKATAEKVALEMLDSGAIELSMEEVKTITAEMADYQHKCSSLYTRLKSMCAEETLTIGSDTTPISISPPTLTKEWYVNKVLEFCQVPFINGNMCAVVLGTLDKEDLAIILENKAFPLSLIESCIAHGIYLSLNKDSIVAFEESLQADFLPVNPKGDTLPLLQISASCLITALTREKDNIEILSSVVQLLAATHQITPELSIDDKTKSVLIDSSCSALCQAVENDSLVKMAAALDYCTLVLRVDSQHSLSEGWACKVITHTAQVFSKAYPNLNLPTLKSSERENCEQQLLSMLSALLTAERDTGLQNIGFSLRHLILALCRMPMFHNLIMTPAVLKDDEKLTVKVLDQALMESEILVQFMQKGNFVGWLNRHQFEERWMQLLGVVNQPPPVEGEFPEEYQAYTLNVCAGVQAVTALLLSTLLRPNLGDPTSSVSMHTHRGIDLLFLGSRPGRKLALVRKALERKILLKCSKRSSLFDYYQSPIQHHLTSLHYPQLFCQNLEREIGCAGIGVCQLSLNSLWPIMLVDVGSNNGFMSVEVDIKSCIISLIELYTHWLANSIHTLQLQFTLHSILLLSDLFAVSSQVEWMLGTMLELYEAHPHEDSYSISLMVLGILKAAAILKIGIPEVEKIVKIVEKTLAPDIPQIIQSACVYGLLYIVEDPNSSLMQLLCPAIAKFFIGCFANFQLYTDKFLLACWSLAVNVVLKHSNHIKDHNFTSRLLENVSLVLHHSNTSFSLFHSVITGLELLVLNFSLSVEDRKAVFNLSSNRFVKCEQAKSTSALALLITCMYTGEAANVASVPQTDSLKAETKIQAREQINNILERIRHGPYNDVQFLIELLPDLIVDFLPIMEVMQTVVAEFVSPHQTRPQLAAAVLNKTFLMLMKHGEQSFLQEWVLLSLDSFVQQKPESKSVWSMTCLLASTCTNELIQSLSKMLCFWTEVPHNEALNLLSLVAQSFYCQCTEPSQKLLLLSKLKESKVPSLILVANYCEEN